MLKINKQRCNYWCSCKYFGIYTIYIHRKYGIYQVTPTQTLLTPNKFLKIIWYQILSFSYFDYLIFIVGHYGIFYALLDYHKSPKVITDFIIRIKFINYHSINSFILSYSKHRTSGDKDGQNIASSIIFLDDLHEIKKKKNKME